MLNGMVIKEGATTALTGGTDLTFTLTGEQLASGVVLANLAETDFFAREKCYVTSRVPALQGDGEYSKQKTSMRIVRPQVLASGKTVYNLVRVETEIHPEAPAGTAANLRSLGIAALADAEANNFWEAGSLQ